MVRHARRTPGSGLKSPRTLVYSAQACLYQGDKGELPPMRPVLLALLLLLAPAVWAQDTTPADVPGEVIADEVVVDEVVAGLVVLDAAGVDPADYLWQRRIVAVMADSPQDPAFIQQMRDIEALPPELDLRDVVVLFDSDRNSGSALRRFLRPRGFMLAVIDKDGEIKQRRPAPRSVREIAAIIDRFPLRRQEMLERNPGR